MFNRERLIQILKTMDVPEFRMTSLNGDIDIPWLNRNLYIRNGQHPDIKEAYDIIREGLRSQKP